MTKNRELPLNVATFISNFGDGLHTLAIGQILFDKTGSASSFGLVISLNYFFGIAMQICAGHLADRFQRSTLVKLSDVLRGLLVLGLALCVNLSMSSVAIVVLSFFIKMGTHLYRPAYQAMIAENIPHSRLSMFNSKNVAAMQGGQLVGMAFFGLLYTWGPALLFVADAITFFISALIVLQMRIIGSTELKTHSSILKSWQEAYQYVRANEGLFLHIVLSASIFLLFPIFELSVVPINEGRFGGDKFFLSLLNGTFSLGCMSSIFIAKYWNSEKRAPFWMLVQALGFASLLLVASRELTLILFFIVGISGTMASIQFLNRLMKRCSNEIQGRISALRYLTISLLISVLLPLLTYYFAKELRQGIFASAMLMLGFAILALFKARALGFSDESAAVV